MSRYRVRIKPRDERVREIDLRSQEAVEAGRVRQEFKFRSGKEPLPVITVPENYLVYRLENYRTSDDQLNLVAEGKREAGFFDPARREDPSVQLAQHQLLLNLAQTGSGQTIKPIYDELERVREQTEPLIITRDGVVVNGNRRLAAMRELLSDPEGDGYQNFANVLCMVLPASATPPEILELEIGLQMQPDTKLPYVWTAIGRAARDLRAAKVSDEKIASLMNRSVQDVQRAIIMIDAADMYLSQWLQRPNAYAALDGTEQAFNQIAVKNLSREDEPQIREITRKFDFFVIENRDQLEERAYDLINRIELNPREFLDQVALEWDIQVPKRKIDAEVLEISFEDGNTEVPDFEVLVRPLIAARTNKEDAKQRVSSVSKICEIVSEQSKEKGKAALKFARQADKNIHAIDLRTADRATWGDIYSLLNACTQRCAELIAEIDSRRDR